MKTILANQLDQVYGGDPEEGGGLACDALASAAGATVVATATYLTGGAPTVLQSAVVGATATTASTVVGDTCDSAISAGGQFIVDSLASGFEYAKHITMGNWAGI